MKKSLITAGVMTATALSGIGMSAPANAATSFTSTCNSTAAGKLSSKNATPVRSSNRNMYNCNTILFKAKSSGTVTLYFDVSDNASTGMTRNGSKVFNAYVFNGSKTVFKGTYKVKGRSVQARVKVTAGKTYQVSVRSLAVKQKNSAGIIMSGNIARASYAI